MKYISIILAAIAFTILLISLYPFRQKYGYPAALPTPTPNRPTPTSTEIKWQTYQNTKYQFAIIYPSTWTVIENENNNIVELVRGGEAITISSSEPEKPCGEQSGTSKPKSIVINQIQFQYYEMDAGICAGLTTSVFKTKTIKTIYISNFGYSERNNEEIKQIINSFTLLAKSKYVCPNTDWVDCMPSPDSPPKTQCQPDYLNWAKINCPNFKGAAL
jgi:hypothetical protein